MSGGQAMHTITFPLTLDMQWLELANLQDALLLLIDRGRIQLSLAERQTFTEILTQEQHSQAYNDGTSKAVALFQQHQQPSTSTVDAPTAEYQRLTYDLTPHLGEMTK